ncbi:MAG: tetratricopeptide repeat protein [Planctomycetota bacterium]|nr:tetratricopeptide repeat protein [Planctomycetota bacterium]
MATEGLLIGQLAMQKGLVTRAQLDECVKAQASTDPPKPIGQILIEKGFVTREQLRGLVSAQDVTMQTAHPEYSPVKKQGGDWEVTRREDVLFGQVALKTGIGQPTQINQALRIQEQMHSQGVTVRLGELMVRQGFLKPDEVKTILAIQNKTILSCPKCNENFNVRDLVPGRAARCPKCSTELVLPKQEHVISASSAVTAMSAGGAAAGRDGLTAAQQSSKDLEAEGYRGEEFGPPVSTPGGAPTPRYRLIALLGQGGMGKVYKAWDCKLKRLVALKQILSEGTTDANQIERFIREAHAAAKLEHPNIVPVYDVGEHAGKHYFTMRFIDGVPLNKLRPHAPAEGGDASGPDGTKLTVRRALEIIRDVARALDYAHKQGVIHRDIKPHNIILDSKGIPFVMDFGLAKDVSAVGKTKLSITGALMGTPGYMSPEHTKGVSSLVGPASDQFSLGIVLYELLTGRTPFTAEGLYELIREICEKEPERPSRVLLAAAEQAAPSGENEGKSAGSASTGSRTPSSRLRIRIPRDIETICLKALEKDPHRRYGSMSEFADDIDRFLNGEPITARTATAMEKLWRKAMRRKSTLVPTAAAVIITLVVALWFALESARKEQDYLRLVNDARQSENAGRIEDALGLYEQARQLKPDEADAVAGAGRCRDTIGVKQQADAHRQQRAAARDAARVFYERAKGLIKFDPASDNAIVELDKAIEADPAYAEAYYERGNIRWNKHELDKAVADLTKAIENDARLVNAYRDRALVYEEMGETQKAVDEFVLIVKLDPGSDAGHFANGNILMNKKEYPRAIEEFSEALKLNPALFWAMCNRSFSRIQVGDLQGAIDDCTQAIKLNPAFSMAYNNRAIAYFFMGDVERAMADTDMAVTLGPKDHRNYVNRGIVRRETGDPDGAIKDFDEALKHGPETVLILSNRGLACAAVGDLAGAIADYDRALEIDPKSTEVYCNRGVVRRRRGDLKGALEDYEAALEFDPKCAAAYIGRGVVRREVGDLDGAITDGMKAAELDPKAADPHNNLGLAYADRGDFDKAIAEYSEALKLKPRHKEALANRGIARANKGDLDGAISDVDGALSLDPQFAEAFSFRGRIRAAMRDFKGAVEDYSRALNIEPIDPSTLCNRGLARSESKDLDGAIADYDQALKLDPKLTEAYMNRGSAHNAKGNIEAAIADWEKGLSVAPADWPFRQKVEKAIEQLKEKQK